MRMPQRGRAYGVAALMGAVVGLSGLPQAHAYSDSLYADCLSSKQNPTMEFQKGSDAPYGTHTTYYSSMAYCGSQLMATRRKVTMKAGSGDGSSDECKVDHGWLPNGSYKPKYEVNHQTSSSVVKGSVWYLGDKQCPDGTWRTALFIHSQGANGGSWTESNYHSLGCVKINQTDRSYLKSLYDQPIYGASNTTMVVKDPPKK